MDQFDWAVNIIKGDDSKPGSAFQPNVPNSQPGQALLAQVGDIVTWGNRTDEPHQPWVSDQNYVARAAPVAAVDTLSAPIQPGQSSAPQYVVATSTATPPTTGTTIYYCCFLHPNRASERGTITITTF